MEFSAMTTSEYGQSNMLVNYDELKEITGYDQPQTVIACLENQGVHYLIGKYGRPWTTLGAIELAMSAPAIADEMFNNCTRFKL